MELGVFGLDGAVMWKREPRAGVHELVRGLAQGAGTTKKI
jgi:hypothetical protein